MVSKPKADVSKSSKRDASPSKKKETISSRTYRKSPARTEKPKSPSRAAVRTPPSSPTRRSPGRKSPSRKSPSRKSPSRKSPARKGPARQAKIADIADSEKANRPVGRPRRQVIDIESDSDSDPTRLTNVEKPKAAVRGHARRLDSDFISPKDISVNEVTGGDRDISSYIGLVRRSTQKSQSREVVDRIVHLKHTDASVQKLTEFSDEDEIPVARSSAVRETSERYSEPKVIEEHVSKTEFGGWIGALLLMFSLPLSVISLYVFCNETECSLTKVPSIQKYKYFSTYLDIRMLLMYSGYALLLAVLSVLPFGGPKVSGLPNKQGKLNYRMNGVFVAIVTGIVLFALEFFSVPVISYIFKNYFQLIISSIVIGWLISVYLYVRSFFVPVSALNPYATSNSRIYNFCIGRELNPRALRVLDMKVFLLRLSFIGGILLNIILVYKSIFESQARVTEASSDFDFKSLNLNPTLLVVAGLKSLYALDFLLFERALVTTFEVQYEAVGYMTAVVHCIGPFLSIGVTKYVYDYGIKLPVWQLAAAMIVFFIGYFLYRGSNLQKHAFRQNPYSPGLSHLESIPTIQGKKLLVSGFWGFVRHPNYLGDIMMILALSLFALNTPPAIIYYADIMFLIQRARRDGARCKQRYGSAWDRYCQRVKYVLIPKVY